MRQKPGLTNEISVCETEIALDKLSWYSKISTWNELRKFFRYLFVITLKNSCLKYKKSKLNHIFDKLSYLSYFLTQPVSRITFKIKKIKESRFFLNSLFLILIRFYRPVPINVERDKTNERLPVATRVASWVILDSDNP